MVRLQVKMGSQRIWWGGDAARAIRSYMEARYSFVQQVRSSLKIIHLPPSGINLQIRIFGQCTQHERGTPMGVHLVCLADRTVEYPHAVYVSIRISALKESNPIFYTRKLYLPPRWWLPCMTQPLKSTYEQLQPCTIILCNSRLVYFHIFVISFPIRISQSAWTPQLSPAPEIQGARRRSRLIRRPPSFALVVFSVHGTQRRR